MTLIPDFARVYLKLWSVRLGALASLLGVLELALPMFEPFIPPRVFLALSVGVGILALIARAIQQPALHDEPAKP